MLLKRIKNIVPQYDRCNAKRANEEQCTRRKKPDFDFCGTHIKGVPHGKVQIEEKMQCLVLNKLEVFVQDIQGIHYYIDISNKSDDDAVELIREKKLDFAIDLNGFTTKSRTNIFAKIIAKTIVE